MNADSIQDQAALWAVRLDAGPLSPDDAAALAAWLDADPARERELEAMLSVHQKTRAAIPALVKDGRLPIPARRTSSRNPWSWAAALTAVTAILLISWIVFPRGEVFSTTTAERKTVTLHDGTRIDLNACTTLHVQLRESERHVRLEKGQALFTVAKNPARPFVVETDAGEIRVTGTTFDAASNSSGTLSVVLIEGGIRATSSSDHAVHRLTAGEKLVIQAGSPDQLRRLTPVELADAVSWREGQAIFRDTPLEKAAAEFARYHGRTITLAPAARALTLGGRFPLDDLEGFLRDLPLALPVNISRDDRGNIHIDGVTQK